MCPLGPALSPALVLQANHELTLELEGARTQLLKLYEAPSPLGRVCVPL